MIPLFREDGGESCNVFWDMNSTTMGFVNEQSAVTFYSFIFGFAGKVARLSALLNPIITYLYGGIRTKICQYNSS